MSEPNRNTASRVAVVTGGAAACAFLCSDDGGYITGQIIGVNGGMYI